MVFLISFPLKIAILVVFSIHFIYTNFELKKQQKEKQKRRKFFWQKRSPSEIRESNPSLYLGKVALDRLTNLACKRLWQAGEGGIPRPLRSRLRGERGTGVRIPHLSRYYKLHTNFNKIRACKIVCLCNTYPCVAIAIYFLCDQCKTVSFLNNIFVFCIGNLFG